MRCQDRGRPSVSTHTARCARIVSRTWETIQTCSGNGEQSARYEKFPVGSTPEDKDKDTRLRDCPLNNALSSLVILVGRHRERCPRGNRYGFRIDPRSPRDRAFPRPRHAWNTRYQLGNKRDISGRGLTLIGPFTATRREGQRGEGEGRRK